jgi:hypothetical protein
MGLPPALLMGFSTVYDPPCDPGINCNYDDKTFEAGFFLWVLIIGVVVLLIVGAVFRDFVTGAWSRRRQRQRDLFARGYRGVSAPDFLPTVAKQHNGHDDSVTFVCPDCREWVYTNYGETLGKRPVDLCRKCRATSTS